MEQEGLYYSSNKGNTWMNTYSAGSNNNIFSIKANPNNEDVMIGTRNGVYLSTNNGLTFNPYNTGMASNSWVYALDFLLDYAFAATSNGLYRKSAAGNWEIVSGILPQDTPKTITHSGNHYYVGSSKGNIYFASSVTAVLLSVYSFTSAKIMSMISMEDSFQNFLEFFLAAKDINTDLLGPGLYNSHNNASNWTDFSTGINDPNNVSALCGDVNGNNIRLYAGSFDNTTNGVRIYQRDYTVGIIQLSSSVPENFSLFQNFPNPFNPSTRIRFKIKNNAEVKLTVFNSLGKEISTLVNENLIAGSYETEFNGSEYNSGVYLYKLEVKGNSGTEFNEIKKMIFLK